MDIISPIALVTDSTADIPDNLLIHYGIKVVPAIMVYNGTSVEDGNGPTREQFYSQLPYFKSAPTTATPSTKSFERVYEDLFNRGAEHIISVHAASTLTGIYNTACLAAKAFENSVHILDGRQLSLGLGFQVLAAAEAITQGAGLTKAKEIIHTVREHARVVAMLDSLEYVRRSGRVSWARARLGNLLNLKSFIELKDGKVSSIGESRTRRKGIERLKELALSQGPLDKLAILHTNSEPDARQFWEEIRSDFPTINQPPIVNVTTIIGVHVGPNGLGFAAISKA